MNTEKTATLAAAAYIAAYYGALEANEPAALAQCRGAAAMKPLIVIEAASFARDGTREYFRLMSEAADKAMDIVEGIIGK